MHFFILKVDKAAEAYMKAARCEADEALAANLYVEAANTMKKVSTSEAVTLMEQAIETFCATGGIRMVSSAFLSLREQNIRKRLQSGMKKILNTRNLLSIT